MAFLWGKAGEKLTPQQAEEQRRVAAALMAQASDSSPVGHWTAAVNRGLQGWLGGRQAYQAREGEKMGDTYAQDVFGRLSGIGGYNPVAEALAADAGLATGTLDGSSPAIVDRWGGGDAPVKPVNIGGSQEEFIANLMPYAMQVSEQYGVAPEIVLAQAALETGWGKSAPGNNFFGIKSHGKAGGNTLATTEVIDGKTVRVNDSFRAYESPGESVLDYGRFLSENPRYRPMMEASGNLDAQIDALGKSGYATDPNYANKIRSIAYGIRPRIGDTSAVAAAPVAGGNSAAILAAMADPQVAARYAPQLQAMLGQTQARENAVFEQQLQAQDPLRQLQIERAQLELAQMREGGGQVVLPAEAQVLQWRATEAGLQPGTPEYQEFIRTGGRITNSMPAAVAALHERAIRAGLQEGTPAYEQFILTAGKAAEAGAAASGKAQAEMAISAPTEIASAQDTLRYIDELINHPGREWGTGASSWVGVIPGTPAYDFQVRAKQLGSGAFLTAIQEMQGFGALSNQEGQTAQAAIARMDTAVSEDEFLKALEDYRGIIQRGMERSAKRIGYDLGSPPAAEDDASVLMAPELNPYAEQPAANGGAVVLELEGVRPEFIPAIVRAAESKGMTVEEFWGLLGADSQARFKQ